MKKLFSLIVLGLLFQGSISLAAASDCQRQYAENVNYCAQSLDTLAPSLRAGAQKACVQQSKLAREICLNGTNPDACVANCQTTYAATVAACEANNNPATCPVGDTLCELQKLEARSQCINQAVDTLNACTAACAL